MSLVKNLKLSFDDFLVDIPVMEIADSGVTALWGPSGAGKTTVMRALLGLDPCAGMSWDVEGQDIALLSPGERNIGVVFQNYELFPHMTGYENVAFAADARKVAKSEFDQKLDHLAKLLSVDYILHKKITVLSGGERQRIALMRALIGKPRILFLDEPFSAFDDELKNEARKLVKSAIEAQKIPVLLVTHEKPDIDFFNAKVISIRNGKLV